MAKQEKIGFKEFQKRFSSEEACEEYLFLLRWANGFVCPKCGCIEYYILKTTQEITAQSMQTANISYSRNNNGQKPFRITDLVFGNISGFKR